MSRIEKSTSRYKNTNVKDFYLDIWEPSTLEPSINDVLMEISSEYHLRPDRLSYDLYGTPRLWWIFAILNKNILVDPINDFVSGLVISVPTKSRVESEVL